MTQNFRAYFAIPTARRTDTEVERAASIRTVAASLAIVGVLAIIYQLLIFYADSWASYMSLLATVIFVLVGAATLIAIRTGRFGVATVILVAGTVLATILFILPYDVNSVTSLILIVPLTMAGVLLDRFGLTIAVTALGLGTVATHFLHYLNVLETVPYVRIINQQTLAPATAVFVMAAVAGILSTVSQRQRALINRLSAESRGLRALSEFGASLEGIQDRARLIQQATDQIRDQFGVYAARVFVYEQQAGLLVEQAQARGGRLQRAERRISATDPANVLAAAFRFGRFEVIGNSAPSEQRADFLPATQTEMIFPLIYSGHSYGVLDVHMASGHQPGANELAVLRTIAGQLALAIQNLEQTQRASRAEEERRRFQEQATGLQRDLERFTQREVRAAWQGFLSGTESGVVGYEFSGGEVYEDSALTESQLKTYRNAMPLVSSVGNAQVLSVPIILRGQVLGVLEFRAPAETPWDGRSIELARTVAQRLALTLENIRLFDQAQTLARRESAVNQISARLEAKMSLEALIREAEQSFAEATGALRARVQFVVPDAERN